MVIYIYTVLPKTIKTADKLAADKYNISPLELVKNAADGILDKIIPYLSPQKNIVILCGKGNNGADGYRLGYLLLKQNYNVSIIDVFSCKMTTIEAATCRKEYGDNNGKIFGCSEGFGLISGSHIIIDAIFGVGFSGSFDKNSEYYKLILAANDSKAFRIAIDAPSGINCADGRADDNSFAADVTVTVSLYKTGLFTYPAKRYCGKVLFADIGLPKSLTDNLNYHALIPDDRYVENVLPKRHTESHKGTYGKLSMFCGSRFMTGSTVLCANAALRSGVGLVNILRDTKTLSILQAHLVEPIFTPVKLPKDKKVIISHADNSNALLIGCGLGKDKKDSKAVIDIIKKAKVPLIIDADGINALCGNINVLKEAYFVPIITPHPAEFSHICGKTTFEVQQNRLNLASEFAKEYNCIVVLKGAATIIASPDGKIAINTTGNAGLSKGGSGDVLAGLCASFVCQGIPSFEAAVCAVYLHGKAADLLSKTISQYGFLPSDLPVQIAKLLP